MKRRFSLMLLILGGSLAMLGCSSQYLTAGKVYLQQNEYEAAEEQFRKALEANPNDAEAHIWLGRTYAQQKEYGAASRELDIALEIDPGKMDAYRKEPQIYWAIYQNAGIELNTAGDYVKAKDRFLRALEIDATRASTKEALGLVGVNHAVELIGAGDYEGALSELSEAIGRYAALERAHFLKGVCLMNLDRREEAKEAFEEAVALDPKDRDSYFNLGLLHILLDEHEDAIAAFQKLIELDETDAEGWSYLGLAYVNVEEYSAAIQALQRAIELDPTNPTSYNNLGIAYSKMGMQNEAFAAFKRAEELMK
jgi:tetratricopeptide (TPR) repeat protein